MLLPSETKFVEKLTKRSIALKRLATKADKKLTIQPVLEKLNAENRDLQHLAKKACTSYLKGVHIMKDKDVFNLSSIDTQKLAFSYGLINAPQLTIVMKTSSSSVGEGKDKKTEKEDRIARLRNEAKARKMQKQLKQVDDASEDDSEKEPEVD